MIVVNSRFLTQKITGVQRFSIEISKQLKQIYGKKIKFVCPYNVIHKELANELEAEIVGNNTGHIWEQKDLYFYLKKNNNPLLLNFANTAPIFYKNKIVTLHDIAFIRCPNAFSLKFRLFYKILIPFILKSSKKILTVSNFSKKEILDVYKFLNSNDIEIVYNAVNENFKKKETNKFNDKYILALSSLNPRKNLLNLIKAFLNLKKEINDKDLKLFLVGNVSKNFNSNEIIKYIKENKDSIYFIENLNDEEIIELYSNAIFFVYPSLYEGFGIPPLEAQACETPVIASNVSSLPEVLEKSVLYCNPFSVEDIKNKMKELLNNKELQYKLKKEGIKNVKRFNWKTSTEKVKNIIENFK